METTERRESDNPYDGGFGAGGKFRKRPFRRTQTTPYDRPPIALRNAGIGNRNNSGGGGWLSKLVDPAQKLITYSAQRLFASVFRKRLTPPEATPPQQMPDSEANKEVGDVDHLGDSALPIKNDMVVQVGEASASGDPINLTNKDGYTELEQILREKTFTRLEIDRLTTLLRSRTVDESVGKEEQRNEVIHSKPEVSQDRDRDLPYNLARENGIQNHLASTPLGSSSVLDEGIAAPAELAKAYMGSRPSEVSPSMLGLRGQVVREGSVLLSNRTPFPPKSPIMSLVPRSSGNVGLPENGFMTPRPRGRSAVYSMARTPYSRPHSAVKGQPFLSASQNSWEESIPSGSKQGLKRRSSVLDNDIGSVGPVRRIRQKANLLSSRSLRVPTSESPLTIYASGAGFDSQHASSSKQDVRPSYANTFKESADNKSLGSSFNPVPSKSSEMASKILQQLDKLVSTREKSPTMLSPSMLKGPALKSLQNVDSSKFLENLQENKLTSSPGTLLSDARETSSQKQDKLEGSGPRKFLAPSEKPVAAVNSVDTAFLKKDNAAGVKGTDLLVINSVEHPPSKKRAFRMSAHEDYLELDDDNGTASTSLAEEREKGNDTVLTEPSKVEKPFAVSELNPPSATYVSNGNCFHATSNGSMDNGKSTDIFTSVASPSLTVQPSGLGSKSTKKLGKDATLEQFNAAPSIFSSGEKVPLQKEANNIPLMFGAFSNTKLEKPSSFTLGATDSASIVPDSDKTFKKSTSEAGLFSSAASSPTGSIFSFGATASSSTTDSGSLTASTSVFPTVSNPSSSSIATQSPLTSPTQSFSATSVFGNLSASTSNNSSCILPSSSLPSFSATTPIFKFGGCATPASASALTGSAFTTADSKEANTKDSTSENPTSVPPSGTTSTVTSTGTSLFSAITATTPGAIFGGSSSAATSTGANNIFGVTSSSTSGTGTSIFAGTSALPSANSIFGAASSPALSSTGGSVFGFSAGAASAASTQSQASKPFMAANAQTGTHGTGTTTTAQSIPFQFGSSPASTPSFGFSGRTSLTSSSSPFGSSTSGSTLFGSGPTSQLGSASSLINPISSSSASASTIFGSNWEAPKSTPIFGSSFNSSSSSSSFSFGGSSGSASSGISTPIIGSSASMPSSTSLFSFNSSPTTTPSQQVFGNSAPGFAFGANKPLSTNNGNNNDQMNMEDNMAEDTDQTKTTSSMIPMFGQPPVSPPPQPSFAFGAAVATPPSGVNPFQFGNQQQNTGAPQNMSPFQASGSLEFNGGGPGGSFSLGSTGGDKSNRRIVKVNRNRRGKK